MKKIILYLIMILVLFTGCTDSITMEDVVKEPNFSGIVEEIEEKSILVRVNEDEVTSSDLIYVSLDVELKDNMIDFNIGDEVRVYYDGNIAESYPAQVNKVYAIILLDWYDLRGVRTIRNKIKYLGIILIIIRELLILWLQIFSVV